MPDVHFLDSSALVKHYVSETGSQWVSRLVDSAPANRIYLSEITAVEITSAIVRRQRSGALTPATMQAVLNACDDELRLKFRRLPVTARVIAQARHLAKVHALRAYDAIQLATAVEVHREREAAGLPVLHLVSADADLNAAAQAEGLRVDNPNQHP